jgi:hypothetical protein
MGGEQLRIDFFSNFSCSDFLKWTQLFSVDGSVFLAYNLLPAPADADTLGVGILPDTLQRVPLVVGRCGSVGSADARRRATGSNREVDDERIVVA